MAVATGIAGAVLFPPAALAIVGASSATALGLVTGWAMPAFRGGWALTPSLLVERPALGRLRVIDLARIVEAEETPARARRAMLQIGPREQRSDLELVATDDPRTVTLRLDDGTERVTAALADARTLAGMLTATITGKIDLDLVPRADRSEVPGELRRDLFFALETTWEKDAYGPCFVGPTRIVRWQSPLSLVRQSILASIAGREAPAEELEAEVAELASVEADGDVAVIRRTGTAITIEDGALVVRAPEREIVIGLAPARLAHARRFLGDEGAYRG